jgi:hypothetical protein
MFSVGLTTACGVILCKLELSLSILTILLLTPSLRRSSRRMLEVTFVPSASLWGRLSLLMTPASSSLLQYAPYMSIVRRLSNVDIGFC